jgi:hypothetical protein
MNGLRSLPDRDRIFTEWVLTLRTTCDIIDMAGTMGPMFIYDDGSREAAGYKGSTGDCVTRAIAIATRVPYQEVYDRLAYMGSMEPPSKRRRGKSHPRTGVHRVTYEQLLADLGWFWTPTMFVGQGCKVHLRKDELPAGRLIARLSKHVCAVIDGVVHDTHDPSRDGTRCVYGYFSQ